MPDVDAILEAPARRFYDSIKVTTERRNLDFVILKLCETPEVDDDLKSVIPFGNRRVNVLADGKFVILYEYLNNWTISVIAIAYDKDFIPWDDIH